MPNKIGLCLSGGGYRATLFSLGSLIRLNELGILSKINRISSVSGGSITNAVLAMNWRKLKCNSDGIISNFDEFVTNPLVKFCSKDFDIKTIIKGMLNPFKDIPEKVVDNYNKELFKGLKFDSIIQEINDGDIKSPQFLFYGTSLQTGSGIRMVDGIYYDWKIGAISISDWELARVVGISSAFPPWLSPVEIRVPSNQWVKGKWASLFENEEFKNKLSLTDGGVYDNMGMESQWKKDSQKLEREEHPYHAYLKDDIDICLVSDAGGPLTFDEDPNSNWAATSIRTTNLIMDQARAVRKRWYIDKLKKKELSGTYWGIATKINNYEIDAMLQDNPLTRDLKKVPTRLSDFGEKTISHLINWGYALVDAAITKHLPEIISLKSHRTWPKNKFPLN